MWVYFNMIYVLLNNNVYLCEIVIVIKYLWLVYLIWLNNVSKKNVFWFGLLLYMK